ncbi:MAG TPA: imidazolonepropionase [Vicinamibacterales bacterium]|nr:imidazolonepropionase [Vicinamibacterales bacterium]
MTRADFLIDDADLVATCAGAAPRAGAAQGDIGALAHASVAAWQGRIVAVGPVAEVSRAITLEPGATVLDGRGRLVVPGFVDSHTHAVFAGDRRAELTRRLGGATYAEIAAAGGGIVQTVAATRAASEDELVAAALPRLAEALAQGTTTCEIKSGYGLTTTSELRMLRAIGRLDGAQPIDVSATFMGAHDVPVEYRGRREDYVRLVIDEMLPAVAAARLAEWNDVFCEHGVFTPEESRRILEAGLALGLRPRIHADELGASGGALTAAAVGAVSADHLIHVDEAGADAMARAGVIATLLPAAAFYLKLGCYAPARMLIARGVPVALATDLNPGGGFTPSLPFVMALAAFGMGLTLEEALVAATINGAAALGRQDCVGSLEPGKQMDAVVIAGTLADLVRVGAPVVAAVVKRGAVVHGPLATRRHA